MFDFRPDLWLSGHTERPAALMRVIPRIWGDL